MNQRVILHLGFWLTYLLLSSYIVADLGNASYRDFSWAFRLGKGMAENVVITIVPAAVFYGLFYRLLPAIQKQNSWKVLGKLFVVLISSVVAFRLIVGYFLYPIVYHQTYEGNLFGLSLVLNSFIKIYSVVGIAGAIKMYRTRQRQKEREQQLIQEKLESELHFLRAQINPHFFFNTLNNIYALARKKSEHTAEVVMRLSKLMRFILYECTTDKIPLLQEIKILEDYISLEKLRYGERLEVSFIKKIDEPHQTIAPLLLLPFVENSFKHGASEMRFQPKINIQLALRKGELFFSIFNNKETNIEENEKGLGLQNVKRQLELLYPNAHDLTITNHPDSFQVDLKILIITDCGDCENLPKRKQLTNFATSLHDK